MASPIIGYLTSSIPSAPVSAEAYWAFLQRLGELGYQDGQNVQIEHRSTQGSSLPFGDLVDELVGMGVNVLVLGDSRAIPAAKQKAGSTPIVMAVSGDVVRTGLVTSLAQPGGNITGLTIRDPFRPLDVARLRLLMQLIESQSGQTGNYSVGVLMVPGNPGVQQAWDDLSAAAPSLGVNLVQLAIQDASDLPNAFADARSQGVRGVVVLPDPLANLNAQQIVSLADQYSLPAIYGTKLFVDAGGLMFYGPDRPAMFRRAADYVHAILTAQGGGQQAAFPIELPSRFEFVINTQAKPSATIPQSLLDLATEVR
jgi:putative ABC transport system substrate-binding protein